MPASKPQKPQLMEVAFGNEEVRTLMSALDTYMRIWMGQYDHIEWTLRMLTSELDKLELNESDRKQAWLLMRDLILPELSGMPLGASHGIWGKHTDDRAQIAYDILQVVRHARAWHKNPKGGTGRDFSKPWIHGSLPPAQCTCEGEDESLLTTLVLTPAHAALMADAVSVLSSVINQNLVEVMSHYTMNEKALSIARSIEEMLPAPRNDEGNARPSIESLLCKLNSL